MTLSVAVKERMILRQGVDMGGKEGRVEVFSVAICIVLASDLSKMAAGMCHPEGARGRSDLTDRLNMAACLC